MFKQVLSFVCRMGVVATGLFPIVAVEMAAERFLTYLIGTAFALAGCYILNRISDRFDKCLDQSMPIKVVGGLKPSANKQTYVA